MSEPLRHAPPNGPVTDADREALIEKLLLAGLDHYFEGSYEQAVNVWTRVVFLERGHGRARAYIERARGALAERQRQAEELLHRGVEAYETGQLEAARELLTRAVEDGGVRETALVFLQRLGRVEPGLDGAPLQRRGGSGPGAAVVTVPRRGARGRRRLMRRGALEAGAATNWLLTAGVSVAVAGTILLIAQPIASWLGERPVNVPFVETRAPEPLPIVRRAEAQLARAQALYAEGRLRDALRPLETIPAADPLRPHADRLMADIQRDLLAALAAPATAGGEAMR
jgi:hypothetical protein